MFDHNNNVPIIRYVPKENQIRLQYPENNNGTHFVLWSGGCDSTLLLYELLDAFGSENVIAVSYKYPWLTKYKLQSEKLHREAFKAKIALRDSKFANFRHFEFDINASILSDELCDPWENGGLIQAVAWVLSVPLLAKAGSKIYHGAIKSDDLQLMTREYSNLFDNVSRMLNRGFQLRMPYVYFTKYEVIDKLLHYDLYEETWYCENPPSTGKCCFKCLPCITHLSALMTLKLITEDEYIALKAGKEIDIIGNGIKELRSNSEIISKQE